MKSNFSKCLLIGILVMTMMAFTENDKVVTSSLTPPMGWNSWDCLDFRATESEIMEVADYMSEHLKEFGYENVVIDAGWYYPPTINGDMGKMDKIPQSIDDFGRLIPDVKKYPSSVNGNGFKTLAKYIHSRGLKFGIHIMRGIPWNAISNNSPIYNSNYKALEIFQENKTCDWNKSMQGLKANNQGTADYYNSLITLYSEWGVDFIKADDMGNPIYKDEIGYLSSAIAKINPKIVLSLSPGPADIQNANFLAQSANMWRITGDFWDNWEYVVPKFEQFKLWTAYSKPGNWPDGDMLPFGKLRKNGCDSWVADLLHDKPENLVNEYSRFSPDEMRTVMSLWCISRSPLMVGGYLPEMDSLTLSIITNKAALTVNQTGINSREVFHDADKRIWISNNSADDTEVFIAAFNLSEEPIEDLQIEFSALGLMDSTYAIYDIWDNEKLGVFQNKFDLSINRHGVRFFKIGLIAGLK